MSSYVIPQTNRNESRITAVTWKKNIVVSIARMSGVSEPPCEGLGNTLADEGISEISLYHGVSLVKAQRNLLLVSEASPFQSGSDVSSFSIHVSFHHISE